MERTEEGGEQACAPSRQRDGADPDAGAAGGGSLASKGTERAGGRGAAG